MIPRPGFKSRVGSLIHIVVEVYVLYVLQRFSSDATYANLLMVSMAAGPCPTLCFSRGRMLGSIVEPPGKLSNK